MKKVYAGIDLHGNNNYLGILDRQGKRIFKKKLPNNPEVILEVLKPFGKAIQGLVVESTFNWYWLVDGLMDEGIRCI
jgi:transposase